ncbi:MAG: glycosyltransferase family 1 protein [Candidatus Levybacteria bacterium]|nr:glycosyltransferase family 1 protein [Candidatus Levybacteria bacterium]MDZ4228168.1 glycosyltransferase family 1 protein [Candidatus Levybacteria bacterium]
MTIGINGYEAVIPRFGYDPKTGLPRRVGSGEYCFELLISLHRIDKNNNYIIYLPQEPSSDLPSASSRWVYRIVGPRRLWTLIGLSLEFMLKRSRVDVFFTPTHYLPLFSPFPSAISVLDLSFIRFPQLFRKTDLRKLTRWTKFSVKKSKRVFTISNASKDDIIKEYRIPDKKVAVTYPGIKIMSDNKYEFANMDELKIKYRIEGKYLLFVGTLQPRKNIVRLIEAFSKIKNNIQLVIVGKKGWLYEEILEAPRKYGVENKVKFLDFVPDEELPSLYKNALGFVLPSLYEGFGLPVLEAMKYGCPVITSNISSLPEAGGDAALYIDPEKVSDIASKMQLLIDDEKLRNNLIEKGYKQVKKFSWEKTARETLSALEGLKD